MAIDNCTEWYDREHRKINSIQRRIDDNLGSLVFGVRLVQKWRICNDEGFFY